MKSRYFALFFLSLLGLLFLPEAKALPPAKPTDGSVRFTRKKMTEQAETYHSYHLRWKDNAPDADGTELQLRFANAGAFYFLTNDQRGYLNAPIPDISERDADGYREAIISVGSPPPGTICQFQVVVWKFNGNKTESSSLLIQTRVPAPNGNADFAPPTNLQRKVSTTEDRVTLSWEDKSDKETYHQIFLAKGSAPSANAYSPLGYIPFGLTEWDIKRYMSFPYNRTTDGQNIATPTTLIPGETYSVAVRALSVGKLPVTDALTLGSTLPLSEAKVTNAATVSFVMPSLRAPSNLKGRVISEASVNLSWEDNSNNETSYEIQYRPVSTGVPSEFSKFGEVGENVSSVDIPIGQLGTAEFRIRAIFAYRKSGETVDTVIPSTFTTETVQLSTLEFLPPTSATATTSGMSGSVDLTWIDNSASEVGFDVFCRPSGTTVDYARCVSLPNNVTKVTVDQFTSTKDTIGKPIFTKLVIGTSYDFIVRALGTNETAASANSNVVTATPRHGFTSRMYQPITQGVAFNHTVTTSNAAQRTSITAAGLPNGLVITSSTGVISGTTTQSGVFPVTLTATFSSGPDAISVLILRVQTFSTEQINLKSPTVSSVIPNLTIGINQPYTISLAEKFADADSEIAVRWETTKGNIDFLLYPSLAPLTVANFMAYVNAGDYTNVFFHRNALQSDNVTPFVLQAGGFAALNSVTTVPGRPSPINEPGISNLQWTIAAAKRGARNSQTNDAVKDAYKLTNPQFPAAAELTDDDFGYFGNPDSATTDIFINLNNNASNLDNQNGGFTAYGRISQASQPTVTRIQSLPVGNYGGALTRLPVDVAGSIAPASPTFAQLVRINKASSIPILTYSVDNLSPEVASAIIENDQLKLIGKIVGTRVVTVTAKDLDNKMVTQTFTITVDGAYQTPSITTQPVSQIITAGTTATLSVTATGTNLSYKWRKNGIDITPPETNANLSVPDFDAADVGDYDVIVFNSNTTLTSDTAKLSLRSPAAITGLLSSKFGEVGKALEIEANVTGSPEPVCVWRRGAVIVAGQTSRKLLIPSAKLSDAGLYTVTASNAAGSSAPGAGGIATVVIIDKNTQYQNVKGATLVKLVAPVLGQGLTYQWKKGGNIISNSEPGFSGQQDTTMTIASATTANIGDYSCAIEAPAGLGSAESGIIRLSVPSQKPALAPFVLPNAIVGLFYRYQITLVDGSSQTGAPGKYVVSGLPTGLICDVNTGFISGIPRASGNFTARATVSNAIGSAIPVSSPLKVLPLVAAASGQYVAQVAPSQPLNNNLGGRLDVILTDNSAYTAALQLAGETFRAVGAFNLNAVSSDYGAGVYESIITFNRPNRKAIRALLFIYTSSGELEGFVSDQVNSTKLYGYRHSWDAKFRSGPFIDYPFAAATGSYKTSLRFNVGLEPEAARIGQTDTPEGGGYLALTMTNGGVATLAGRLADGTSVTSGTLVSLSAQLYVFQAINLNTSSLGGFISLATPLSGDLRWTKGRQPISERIYQPGFSPTTLKAFGSIYFAPAVNTNALQVSEIDKNARINFTRGGLTSTDPNLSIRVSPKNAVTYPTTNPAKVALTINPSTGLISGSFELQTPEKRKASYQGMIVERKEVVSQNPQVIKNLPPTGIGHFLLPGLTPTVATSAIRSGLVSMNGIFITSQPSSQNVAIGSNVTLSVDALVVADLTALTYQWQKNGVALTDGAGVSGATTATLSLTAIDEADIAEYKCLIKSGTEVQAISNGAKLGIVISSVVLSRSTPAPTVETPHVALNTPVTLSVTSMGPEPTYQWYKNNVLIPGAKTSTYSFNSGPTANTTNYNVRVFNSATPGGVLSNSLPVSVIDGVRDVVITRTAPTTSSVAISSPFTLSVSAYGEALTYQWKDGNGADIAGETGPTYGGTSRITKGSESYSVVVKNPLTLTGITSSTFTVNVIDPITGIAITKTNPNEAVGLNKPVTLNVTAMGDDLTYQWLRGTTVIPGATGTIYSFTSATIVSTTNYFVRVNNGATTASGILSAAFPVTTVSPLSNVQIRRTAPTTASVATGAQFTLTASAAGSSLSYVWYKDNVVIADATNPTYTFTEAATSSPKFKVKVSNPLTPAGLESSELTVNVITPVSGVVASRTAPSGGTVPRNVSVTLSVTANGTSPTYQWYRGTTLIAGATSATYVFNSGASASTLSYNVRVTNAAMATAVTSNSVSVQVAP